MDVENEIKLVFFSSVQIFLIYTISLAGNIIVYTPNQGTISEEYLHY